MAKRKCDPTSGSIGQETYLISRNGQAVRARVYPRPSATTAQTTQRAILAQVAARWRSITDVQRAQWQNAALAHMSKPRLGMSGPLTGEQLFCRVNSVLGTFGQDQMDVPPAYPVFTTLAPVGLVITNTNGNVSLNLTCPGNPGENTIIRGSAPVSAGIARTPRVVILGTCPAPAAGSADITGLYSAKWGMPAAGSRVFVQGNQFIDGWESTLVTWSAVVPA